MHIPHCFWDFQNLPQGHASQHKAFKSLWTFSVISSYLLQRETCVPCLSSKGLSALWNGLICSLSSWVGPGKAIMLCVIWLVLLAGAGDVVFADSYLLIPHHAILTSGASPDMNFPSNATFVMSSLSCIPVTRIYGVNVGWFFFLGVFFFLLPVFSQLFELPPPHRTQELFLFLKRCVFPGF